MANDRRTARPSRQPRPSRPVNPRRRDDRPRWGFEVEVATELLALLEDVEGNADEALLDVAERTLSEPPAQRPSRDVVLLALVAEERSYVLTLLADKDGVLVPSEVAARVATRLRRQIESFTNRHPAR